MEMYDDVLVRWLSGGMAIVGYDDDVVMATVEGRGVAITTDKLREKSNYYGNFDHEFSVSFSA